jgi:hypothetical protein
MPINTLSGVCRHGLVLLASFRLLCGECTKASLEGVIKNQLNDAIMVGEKLDLAGPDGKEVATTLTDRSGTYRFCVQDGTYSVRKPNDKFFSVPFQLRSSKPSYLNLYLIVGRAMVTGIHGDREISSRVGSPHEVECIRGFPLLVYYGSETRRKVQRRARRFVGDHLIVNMGLIQIRARAIVIQSLGKQCNIRADGEVIAEVNGERTEGGALEYTLRSDSFRVWKKSQASEAPFTVKVDMFQD